jgi:hypothetical protein
MNPELTSKFRRGPCLRCAPALLVAEIKFPPRQQLRLSSRSASTVPRYCPIIVETASRFVRDLMVQEVGHAKLRERGIDLIAADNPGSFIDDTPTAKLVRQVLGAISEFDKSPALKYAARVLTDGNASYGAS